MKFKPLLMASISTLLLASSMTIAAKNSTDGNVTLAKYYRATCQDYAGTWQGFISDPMDLFGDGGPWPVTVNLVYQDGRIMGQTSPVNYAKDSSIETKKIWAQCHDGVLSNIFWGEKNACGSFSEEGVLVSKNVLALKLNYEKAMNGTNFLLILNKASNSSSFPLPKNKQEMILNKVESCHD